MLPSSALQKLWQGNSLHQEDKKEIVRLLSGKKIIKPRIFVKRDKLERSIFKTYILKGSLTDLVNRYREGLMLLFKEKLNQQERSRLKILTIITQLIQSIEIENNVKNSLYQRVNTTDVLKDLQAHAKKEIENIAIKFGIDAIAHHKKIN
ncbi:MAG: hypothetical protein V4700_05995 [Pseudomonadota bacterium]